MLHYETISPSTLGLLTSIQSIPFLHDTCLVGGTALALQMGHRKSIDLDIFGSVSASSAEIRQSLSAKHDVQVLKESENIDIYLVDGVKVDFVNYSYGLVRPVVVQDNLRLASIEDIAAIKISAVIGRGTKKDFVDLFFLLKRYSLKEILELYSAKYPDGTLFIALKSLTYFEDAESDPMPEMLESVNWAEIKETVSFAVRSYLSVH
jgi:hypothetical protein